MMSQKSSMVSCSEVTLNVYVYIDSNDDDSGLMWTVVYEDGDKEDLDPQEGEEVVTLSDDIKSGRAIIIVVLILD